MTQPYGNDHNQNGVYVYPPVKPQRRRMATWLALVAVVVGASSAFFILRNNANVSAASAGAVEVTGTSFSPQTIKVRKGASVTWFNQDTAPHQIVANPNASGSSLPGLDSTEPLAQGETYTATFSERGTYSYHDSLNPAAFNGTVIVE